MRLGQFQLFLKTGVISILNFTRPHAISYTNIASEVTQNLVEARWRRNEAIEVHVCKRLTSLKKLKSDKMMSMLQSN